MLTMLKMSPTGDHAADMWYPLQGEQFPGAVESRRMCQCLKLPNKFCVSEISSMKLEKTNGYTLDYLWGNMGAITLVIQQITSE